MSALDFLVLVLLATAMVCWHWKIILRNPHRLGTCRCCNKTD
jgi:hypothetical protein